MAQQNSETSSTQSNLLQALSLDGSDREQASSRSPLKWTMGFLCAAIVLIGLYYRIAAEPTSVMVPELQSASQQDTPAPVWPLPAQSSQTSSVLDATGYVTARRQATVSSQITGRVLEVFIEEGDEVVEGQLLALLDDSLLLAQYRLAESQLSASRAALLDLHVQQKEAQLGLQRLQALADRSLISQAELDEALLKLESVEARTTVVTRQIAVAQSSVHLQSQQLAQTEIRAPFAGVVISKAAQPGEIISPVSAGGSTRTGISAIVDMTSLEIEVDVNESNINRVSSGQRVMARLNSYPDWEIPAEVITVIPAADRSRATVRVRIRFLEKDARVLPDMGVRVSFLEDKPKVDD